MNTHIESFNGKLRDECLNEHVFLSLYEAQEIIEKWRNEYNLCRPHSAHKGLTPYEMATGVVSLSYEEKKLRTSI